MKAKHVNTSVSIKGKNVASVRKWELLVEVVLTDGQRLSFHPNENVTVMPARDTSGKFLAKEYVLTAVVDGLDMAWSVTGRSALRNLKRALRDLTDTPAIAYAI